MTSKTTKSSLFARGSFRRAASGVQRCNCLSEPRGLLVFRGPICGSDRQSRPNIERRKPTPRAAHIQLVRGNSRLRTTSGGNRRHAAADRYCFSEFRGRGAWQVARRLGHGEFAPFPIQAGAWAEFRAPQRKSENAERLGGGWQGRLGLLRGRPKRV